MELEKVVREFLIETGRTEHRFVQALQLGIACLRELHYDVIGVPVIKELTVSEIDTVDLPNDYLNYIRIGYTDSYGCFREIGVNDGIALNRTLDDCGKRIARKKSTDDNSSSSNYNISNVEYSSVHYRNNENVGRYYGLGGGNNLNGSFKIDKNYQQIQLSQYKGGATVTLEYLADPNKTDGEFMVHPFAVETIKSWIDWKLTENNANIGAGVSERKRQLYGGNKKLLRSRMSSKSVQDLLQAFRKGNKASPKF